VRLTISVVVRCAAYCSRQIFHATTKGPFVRFRHTLRRLQVSLIETSRTGGKVRHEHVASLGSIDDPPTVEDRLEFWRRLHERFGQLSNRIAGADHAKILGAIHDRIPMVAVDDIGAVQLSNTEADEHFWSRLRDMHQGTAEDHKQMLATVQRAIATAEAQAADCGAKAEAAKDRARRLRNGEAVPGGLRKPLGPEDFERILRDAGWTTQDIEHCRVVHRVFELGAFDELMTEIQKAHRRAELAAARALLRRLGRRTEGGTCNGRRRRTEC
jgi:hypothetical protein